MLLQHRFNLNPIPLTLHQPLLTLRIRVPRQRLAPSPCAVNIYRSAIRTACARSGKSIELDRTRWQLCPSLAEPCRRAELEDRAEQWPESTGAADDEADAVLGVWEGWISDVMSRGNDRPV